MVVLFVGLVVFLLILVVWLLIVGLRFVLRRRSDLAVGRRRRRPLLGLVRGSLRRYGLSLLLWWWLDRPNLLRIVHRRGRVRIALCVLWRIVVLPILRRWILGLWLIRPRLLGIGRLLVNWPILLRIRWERRRPSSRLHTGRYRLRSLRAIFVIRRLVWPPLLLVVWRRYRPARGLDTRGNRLRMLLLIGVVCRRILVHLRGGLPLDSLRWVGARRSTRRIGRVGPRLRVALRDGTLISSHAVRSLVSRCCHNGASRQRPDLGFLPHGRSNRNCARSGRDLLALLIDENRPLIGNRNWTSHRAGDNGSRRGSHLGLLKRARLLHLARINSHRHIAH